MGWEDVQDGEAGGGWDWRGLVAPPINILLNLSFLSLVLGIGLGAGASSTFLSS